MKIFVMVDMEGISGICRSAQVSSDDAHYQAARRYMVWDVNACVEGCLRGGATRVVVRDAHGGGFNFIWDELDPRADYVQGTSHKERIPGIGTCDGMVLLGYHAMAGTPHAILEHTMSSRAWQNFWINGRKAGEVAIDAAIAGDHGVPTIMVSGDDKVCKEARRLVKGIHTAQVKKGLHCQGGVLLPKEKAHKLIADTAARAVKSCAKIKPYKVRQPVTLRLELVERGDVPVAKKHVKIIDGRTYEVTGRGMEQTFSML